MKPPLKLDFNERADQLSPLASDSRFAQPLWRYPERQALQQQIAALNQLKPEQVLCTNGGDEAIMLLMRIVKESARMILPLPAFSQYLWGVESWQLDAQLIAADENLAIDVTATINAIEQTSGAVVVITRPNNPTGEMIPLTDLLNIVETAQKNQCWVFLDEAYIEFSENFSVASIEPNSLMLQFDNLVILRTFSKAFGLAGIRLGYLLGNPQLIAAFAERCLPFNIPQPSLSIAASALSDENRSEVDSYCQVIRQNRLELQQWLSEIGVKVLPSQANFITLQLNLNQALAVKSFLAKNNIQVRSFTDALMQNCLRITIPFQLEPLKSLLQQSLRPDLICLDMDGVLIDTSGSYEATIIATVKKLADKIVTSNDVERLKNAGGFNNDWVLTHYLLQQSGFDYSLAQVTEVFQSIYLGENGDGLFRNEKAMINSSMVNTINTKQTLRFAIVTGRPRFEAEAGRELVGFKPLDIISLDDVDEPKPSPEGIKKLQCLYSNFSWMCGDNPDDMLAAKGSNSLAIGIGRKNAAALYQAGADIVLDSINELEEWL